MKTLRLPTVYSLQADAAAVAAAGLTHLPHNLSQHQLETYLAMTRGRAAVVFNQAITGDGKTLAGLLPLMQPATSDYLVMNLYPTNELIRDQHRAVEQMQRDWATRFPVREITGRTLDEAMETAPAGTRGNALMRLFSNADLALTNPDIFHYIMQMFYVRKGEKGEAPDKIWGRLIPRFSQLTFDEFHIFETPQVISVVTALLFLLEIGALQRYLFLSATPNETMLRFLDHAGVAHETIEGTYCYGDDPGLGWRRILQEAELHVVPGRADEWIMAQAEALILPFFQDHAPGAKGAIIVNSVATAERLADQLRRFFEERGLPYTVEKNTGLTGPAARRRSYEADLLVGTSTVDVGVDFRINFLIFESRDGNSFLQRLGRLGRHADFTRPDGTTVRFERFVAHALVPEFVFERLFAGRQGEPPLLGDAEEVDRARLSAAIRDAFPRPTDFSSYAHESGSWHPVAVITELSNKLIRDSYAGTRKQLKERYQKSFGISPKKFNWQMHEIWHGFPKDERLILDEARSFRGGSPWQAAVIDERTREPQDRLLLYDLRTLLANYHISLVSKAQFTEEASRLGVDLRRFERARPLAYLRLHGLREARMRLTVTADEELTSWSTARFDTVQVLRGLGLEAEFDEINALNRSIAGRPFVALVTTLSPAELQRRLYLPWPFPIEYLMGNDRVAHSIAFGREALLLETAMKARRLQSDRGGAMIV